MKKHDVPLELLISKNKIKTKIENGEIYVPAEVENLGKHRHHINVPGKYKLPFRIDMTVSVKYHELNQIASQMRLYIDKGNIYFNGGHTSVTDIITGDDVPPCFISYNSIPTEEYVDISIVLGIEIMWVAVNGQFCYVSDKMPYMERVQENTSHYSLKNGVDISICGGTATRFSIKVLSISEYEYDEIEVPNELTDLPALSAFELFVKGLPAMIQDKMVVLDDFLMNEIKSAMKFRKSINKTGHLTYESSCGFKFEIKEYGAGLTFLTAWVKNDKKPDYTNDVIHRLAESSSDFAKKIFTKMHRCEGHSRGCARTVMYEFSGESKLSCCGRMNLKMDSSGFEDLKSFITAASEVILSVKKNQ